MDNQDIRENQVTIVNEREKNIRLVRFKEQKSKDRNSSDKERQESYSNLISKLPSKRKKKRRKRESSTDSRSLREVSKEVTLQLAKKKKYCKKRRRNNASNFSDSSLSDGKNSDDLQHARFKIVTEDEKLKWKHSKEMANYATKYLENFSPRETWKKQF